MWEQITNEMISRMKEGDEQAFRSFYELTKRDVYRTVAYLTGDREDVSDIVSEIYLELILSLDHYMEEMPLRSWMNGLIVRQARNWNRKLWRKFRIAEKKRQFTIEVYEEGPDRYTIANERRREMMQLLDQLSYKLRAVVVLRYYQDLTLTEIAVTLGIPVGTVKSRHDLAIKKLRSISGEWKNGLGEQIHV